MNSSEIFPVKSLKNDEVDATPKNNMDKTDISRCFIIFFLSPSPFQTKYSILSTRYSVCPGYPLIMCFSQGHQQEAGREIQTELNMMEG